MLILMLLLEDVDGYMRLAPANACTANFAARQLVAWCAEVGAPKIWARVKEHTFETESFGDRPRRRFGAPTSVRCGELRVEKKIKVERAMQKVFKTSKATRTNGSVCWRNGSQSRLLCRDAMAVKHAGAYAIWDIVFPPRDGV